jgi:hypothetical protein
MTRNGEPPWIHSETFMKLKMTLNTFTTLILFTDLLLKRMIREAVLLELYLILFRRRSPLHWVAVVPVFRQVASVVEGSAILISRGHN